MAQTPSLEPSVLVCTTCRRTDDIDAEGARAGARLHDALAAANDGSVRIVPVECLSVCKRPVTVGFAAEGHWTYVYGDFGPEAAGEIIATAKAYAAAPAGIIPWRERPQAFRKGVVARIPPITLPVIPTSEAAE